jgi:integrase
MEAAMLRKIALTRVPSYRHHKPTGQAVVTLSGQDIYLGKWNAKASRDAYDRLIGEWMANGRRLPQKCENLTVAELVLRYWRFATSYYRKDGRLTGSIPPIRVALRLLRRLYGTSLAADIGPLALEAIQHKLIAAGKSRSTINELVAIIRRAFRWAVAKELVHPDVYHALTAVPGLKKGRSDAREPEPIRPVADDVVDATLSFLPKVVADMVSLQRLTGCRPGEVCRLRPCDIDRCKDVWAYRPQSHKTEHRDRERVIFIGPKGQAILLPYLLRDAEAHCFSPVESENGRHAEMRARRRSRVQPSQQNRHQSRPKRMAGRRYNKDSYNRAIRRAIDKANRQRATNGQELLTCWRPNQLRHSMATEVRKQFGLEAAQVTLGHAYADVSQIYAERDLTLAAEVMRKIG